MYMFQVLKRNPGVPNCPVLEYRRDSPRQQGLFLPAPLHFLTTRTTSETKEWMNKLRRIWRGACAKREKACLSQLLPFVLSLAERADGHYSKPLLVSTQLNMNYPMTASGVDFTLLLRYDYYYIFGFSDFRRLMRRHYHDACCKLVVIFYNMSMLLIWEIYNIWWENYYNKFTTSGCCNFPKLQQVYNKFTTYMHIIKSSKSKTYNG